MKIEDVNLADAIALVFEFGPVMDQDEVRVMARRVEQAMSSDRPIRLLLDFRQSNTFEPGAFLSPEGTMASLKSINPLERYIVVGAPDIAETAIKAFGPILPLKAMTFDTDEMEKARAALIEGGAADQTGSSAVRGRVQG